MLIKLRCFLLSTLPLIVFCWFLNEAHAQPIKLGRISSEGLSAKQARKVLDYVFEHEKVKPNLPHTFIESNSLVKDVDSPFSKYYTFVLYHSDPNAAALSNLGWFAVSKDTGDVFEIHTCKRFQFSSLQVIQRKIMKQTGKTIDEERQLQEAVDCFDGVTLQGKFSPE